MTRYRQMFDRLDNKGAFGAFVMLGDPDIETSAAILDALVEGGADMIELGIPFSDPVADGPVIQAAAERALANRVTPSDCFALIRDFRAKHASVPVGILTYANIVLARGMEAFYRSASVAGVDSVLVADVPAFEAEPFARTARAAGVAPVMIAAPNTPSETLQRLAVLGGGYTYCVARAGVTGAGDDISLNHDALFGELRRLGAPPPVLGFGISTPDHVKAALDAGAAGVISGSAIVRLIEAGAEGVADRIRAFVASMKEAA
ncbi:MAG: tryptophan synthase subunit alpha [Sphingosinicella sp.]|nr:tryptophan synthase subunit alpha [Sphingosinicella sp.]